ncbi:MAG: MarR family transcriptional regulator [Alphaproteobacteria bacterium]|nr:MarR family transcriptional regulator [Alphaproteobacteria bacterium]MCZ6813008.1 MarR family transcriptional regulator [Alphaproteobacteria bacterium]MCZ6849262.1 MarR family transcriptional regulator [Alphaproteobacteria bacterium]
MADLKSSFNPLFLREEDLRDGMELLFFAYRDFLEEADQVLARHKLGRAHHRALYFIGQHPAITVSGLLKLLRITKQSLSRVLADLVTLGMIEQTPGLRDRRQRHLALTAKGIEVERDLTAQQRALLARAYRQTGAEAVDGFRKVLLGLITEGDRRALMARRDQAAESEQPVPARARVGRAGL